MNFLKRNQSHNVWSEYFPALYNQLLRNFNDDSLIDTTLWNPLVDIKEDEKQYTVQADLPGVEDKDLSVTLENNLLTIKGERHFEKKENDEGFSRTERFEGQFYRRFNLPEAIDGSKIQAEYKKGVLKICIPKRETAKTNKIDVKISN